MGGVGNMCFLDRGVVETGFPLSYIRFHLQPLYDLDTADLGESNFILLYSGCNIFINLIKATLYKFIDLFVISICF
jgi:hypothetical protein